MNAKADLRAQAEGLGHALPALLAQAEHLATLLAFGAHGRRRAGAGDEFWQYRPAEAGDGAQAIDWRRSAKTDAPFVRQREWQALNSVGLWVDTAASMRYTSAQDLPSKAARAQVLALSLGVMLLRGGERVGLTGGRAAKTGRRHLADLAAEMLDQMDSADYGTVQADGFGSAAGGSALAGAAGGTVAGRTGRLVYLSDFLGPIEGLKAAMMRAADQGARGVLIQVLDPSEESFPFSGRTVFLSMAGSARFETQSADDLRAQYQQRLAARKDELAALARALGWSYCLHHTDSPPLGALIWAHHALSKGVA